MIDVKKVREYIENKNHIKLSSIQYQILKAIIRGDEIYTPRGIGRSTLYDGYADYLKNVLGKDTNRTIAADEFDSIFTADMMLKDEYFNTQKFKDMFERTKALCPESFNREYECIYEVPKKEGKYIFAKNIKENDMFIYNGCEVIAINNYAKPFVWVTSSKYWSQKGEYVYPHATIIRLEPYETIKYLGKMETKGE